MLVLNDGAQMTEPSPLLVLDQACDEAVDWVVVKISQAGLRVVRTFDLQMAMHTRVACPCPYHGTQACDCQMVVMLVYATPGDPVTLIAHGHNHHTWFSLVDTPQQRASPRLEAAIRHAIGQATAACG